MASTSMPTLKVSEIFESIQGEGASAGEPAVFLRLATCNLHCSYCDTKYTWDFNAHRYEDEVKTRRLDDVAAELDLARARRLVVTGGEPLLQSSALGKLLEEIADAFVVEVETNGTLAPTAELIARVAQWNVSPKLSGSGNREGLRLRPAVLAEFRKTQRAWLKLVVADERDVAEAAELVARLSWPSERVLLMPEAQTRDELHARSPLVSAASLARGFGFSPRLHIERFGGRRGT
ncbi:MAG: 7-carboxy-7-deazaguanine synthase QueE [Myxococcales bacterium]|nr:7-carboxy-7-deazaguanine synthase QueE [Myxococcales bacterium]